MRAGDLLEKRQEDWAELERMCDQLQSGRKKVLLKGSNVAKFAMLYRSACSDLAMGERYNLPSTTIDYLHQLVGRAHNQLYSSNRFDLSRWTKTITQDIPRSIFNDVCVHVAAVIFFGLFTISAILGRSEQLFPNYPDKMLGQKTITSMEEMYKLPLQSSFEHYVRMSAFYIQHNTSIGLTCYGKGILIIPCVIELAYQASYLGCIFGYMARPNVEAGNNFFQFVTAHGPFELSAIALSAAAGLRLGVGLIATAGLMRFDSLRVHALRSLPIGVAAICLFVLAAFTEAVISPSAFPYAFKALWAIGSSTAMTYYFVVLGYPRGVNQWS